MNLKSERLIEITKHLRDYCDYQKEMIIDKNKTIEFAYNPLNYAWKPHEKYLEKYGGLGAKTIIMGMNPGHGMGNTGIPFGCPKKVKNYLKIENLEVGKPANVHPKRKVSGLDYQKAEISGTRIWSLIEEIYGPPSNAFKNIFVLNHFPLWMFNAAGQNITPDKLKASSTKEIFTTCNKYLVDIINILNAKVIVGVGKYAFNMAKRAIDENQLESVIIKEIPHPSPANPLANKDKGAIWTNMSKHILE
tara:strand:- start:919 stop:1662 length:744 start_codon:yes stop_codon:yes gene_type:complete